MNCSSLTTTTHGDALPGKLKKVFGQNVRRYRSLFGLTQRDLSDRLGISISQVQKMEQGVTGASFDLIEKLAKLFQIPADLLLRRHK